MQFQHRKVKRVIASVLAVSKKKRKELNMVAEFACGAAIRHKKQKRIDAEMPDSLRYLIILAVLGGVIYGGAWWLANFPPKTIEIEKTLSNDRLRG